jgi:hypothetical protein
MASGLTGFIVAGEDLSFIFQPILFGYPTDISTNFYVNVGTLDNAIYKDLNQIFASINSGTSITTDTGFKVNNTDLKNIFAKYMPLSSFNLGKQGILCNTDGATYTLCNNFTLPSGYTHFNFIIYGSGGGGYQNTSSVGGGGSGGTIIATNIPYNTTINNSSYYISSINYIVQTRNNSATPTSYTTVIINYANTSNVSTLSITLGAGSGVAMTSATHSTNGASGGTNSISNTGNIPYTLVNLSGNVGGNSSSSGNSYTNVYTQSGNGNNGSNVIGTATRNIPAIYSDSTHGLYLFSQGTSISNESAGYGAGGSSSIANYNPGYGIPADHYRYGTAGVIGWWLS